jgi:predicted transcriptional regulator
VDITLNILVLPRSCNYHPRSLNAALLQEREIGSNRNMAPIRSSPGLSIMRVNSTVKDFIAFLYNLSPLDLDILLFLIKINPQGKSLQDLAVAMDKDKSTVFRSLQRLASKGIVRKETRPLKGRGYYHMYSSIDRANFMANTQNRAVDIKKSLDRLLKSFESDLEKTLKSL